MHIYSHLEAFQLHLRGPSMFQDVIAPAPLLKVVHNPGRMEVVDGKSAILK